MTPAPEKAAPIPAEAEKLANDLLAIANASVRADGTDIPLGETCRKAALLLADREARPSLPDSREERIRAEAAEDERDRLYLLALGIDAKLGDWAPVCTALLIKQGGMHPADRARARQGGNNG